VKSALLKEKTELLGDLKTLNRGSRDTTWTSRNRISTVSRKREKMMNIPGE
jgi:hypothetical protein